MVVDLSTLHAGLSGSSSCVTAVRVEQMATASTCMSPTRPHLHSTITSSGDRLASAHLLSPFMGYIRCSFPCGKLHMHSKSSLMLMPLQMVRNFRKPLIIQSPKILLRLPVSCLGTLYTLYRWYNLASLTVMATGNSVHPWRNGPRHYISASTAGSPLWPSTVRYQKLMYEHWKYTSGG